MVMLELDSVIWYTVKSLPEKKLSIPSVTSKVGRLYLAASEAESWVFTSPCICITRKFCIFGLVIFSVLIVAFRKENCMLSLSSSLILDVWIKLFRLFKVECS